MGTCQNMEPLLELEDVVKNLPDFYLPTLTYQDVSQQLRHLLLQYVKNTPHGIAPTQSSSAIDIPRVRVGICAVLLSMLGHYRECLNSKIFNQNVWPCVE